eukprot:972835-Amphidinium_carterae.1
MDQKWRLAPGTPCKRSSSMSTCAWTHFPKNRSRCPKTQPRLRLPLWALWIARRPAMRKHTHLDKSELEADLQTAAPRQMLDREASVDMDRERKRPSSRNTRRRQLTRNHRQ